MKQMTDIYDYYRCSVLGVLDVPRDDTASYGIVKSCSVADRVERIEAIVEKPQPDVGRRRSRCGRALHPDAAHFSSS